MKQDYLLRVYDTFYNGVIREFRKSYSDENVAIASAKSHLFLMYSPADYVEIQLCVKTHTLGAWQMIGYVAYENDNPNMDDLSNIYYEECFG